MSLMALRHADDAEWMFGIPAFIRLAILTEVSAWMTNEEIILTTQRFARKLDTPLHQQTTQVQ